MRSLCLTAIVKNSGPVLSDCLRSFLPYVNHFVICDTGSSDDTMERLREETKNYDGYLFEETFTGFSHNRNRVIEEAEKRYPDCYYVMVDDSFILKDGPEFIERMKEATDPIYSVMIRNDDNLYLSSRIFIKGMRYYFRLHEVILTEWKAKCLDDVTWVESQVKDHKKRTAERRVYDIEQLHLDLIEYPNHPRVLYYLARTYVNDKQFDKAQIYFRQRILIPEADPEYQSGEIFRAMLYLTMIDQIQGKSTSDLLKSYIEIHKEYPNEAEPLFFAAMCLGRLGQHEFAVSLLEEAMKLDFLPGRGLKYCIYENDLPKALCSYYFKLNVSKCAHFLFEFYSLPKMKFDFVYETYLRHIHRISPTITCPYPVVVYKEEDTELDYIIPTEAKVYTEQTLSEYIETTTCYQVEHMIVFNRVDRIPFFPNVKKVYLVIIDDVPKGGSLEQFPALINIIIKNNEHLEILKTSYLHENCLDIVRLASEWTLTK